MRTIDYDTMYDENTGSTETHLATDEFFEHREGDPAAAFREGFASASGVRNETAETGGRIKTPELKDAAQSGRIMAPAEEENAGLADS